MPPPKTNMSSSPSSPHEQDGVVAPNPSNEGNTDVVYKKGSAEAYTWDSKIEDKSSDAFFQLWCNQYQKLKPRVVFPKTTTPLKWLSNHMNIPDNASALVRAFLVKKKIPTNVINNSKRYRKTNGAGRGTYPHVVLDGLDNKDSLNSFWAVVDSRNPQRVFIGQITSTYSTMSAVCGGIWYFDNDGNVEERLKPFATTLIKYDYRNGSPSPDNVFLCGDSLCYIWSHRDVGQVWVDGWVLQEDTLKGRYANLTTWFNSGERETSYSSCTDLKPVVLDKRWLGLVSEKTPKSFFIDLKSIRKGPGAEADGRRETTLCDSFTMPSSMDPLAVIKNLHDVPTYDVTMRDGYPVKCVKCSLETAEGSIRVAGGEYTSAQYGLGQAVCDKCCIRYSKSNGNWECWNMVMIKEKYLDQCNQVVHGPDYECTMDHQHVPESDMSFVTRRTERKRRQSTISVVVKRSKTD